MELQCFIRDHMSAILAEWDGFAQSLLPISATLSRRALRDHAEEILQAVALDIETEQTAQEQTEKSQGLTVKGGAANTAAAIHGAMRQDSDFSLTQLAAEFRALRATVLRLWLPDVGTMSRTAMQSMIRFNEAVDQALAESIAAYSANADQTRELFLAVLGHDLRAPLATMTASAELLMQPKLQTAKIPELGARVQRSARLMSGIVDDLLGYTRSKLGVGVPTTFEAIDLNELCRSAVEDAGALHPATRFELNATGVLVGSFDRIRVIQLLTNLLKNAAQYGARESAVLIDVAGDLNSVTINVTNEGSQIPEGSLESIFQPLVRLSSEGIDSHPRTSLGLGLFIAREAALAHGGSISVSSDEIKGTTFTVCLPKES